jgi:uncharacterized membrane protein
VNLIQFLCLVVSDGSSIAGQLCLKRGMNENIPAGQRRRRFWLLVGIGSMTVGFFFWLGLLPQFQLSYIFPFEAMDRIFLALAASWFLKEQVSLQLWIGMFAICAGSVLVGLS